MTIKWLLELVLMMTFAGASPDPADRWVKEMENAPAARRPPNFEHVKALMARKPPAVGEEAPDFTLKTLDGKDAVTLSKLIGERPVVLIFGSYT